MNLRQQNSLLRSIDSNSNTLTTNSNTNILTLGSINSSVTDIDTTLDTISNNISQIKTDVDTLAKTKVIFNARLTDGTNNYLARSNYSGGNAIDFYWRNDKNTPVYIYKYCFTYPEGSSGEPTESELYHSTAWDSKIGALNTDETDYEAPYITVSDNKDYFQNKSSGGVKQSWATNTTYIFQKDLNEAPIEIGISRKFGHYINGNIDTTNYGGNPVGLIEGYYYSS